MYDPDATTVMLLSLSADFTAKVKPKYESRCFVTHLLRASRYNETSVELASFRNDERPPETNATNVFSIGTGSRTLPAPEHVLELGEIRTVLEVREKSKFELGLERFE